MCVGGLEHSRGGGADQSCCCVVAMETNPASTTRDTKPNTFRVAPAGWTPRPADRIGFDGLLLGLIEALVPPAATEAADEFEEMKEALET